MNPLKRLLLFSIVFSLSFAPLHMPGMDPGQGAAWADDDDDDDGRARSRNDDDDDDDGRSRPRQPASRDDDDDDRGSRPPPRASRDDDDDDGRRIRPQPQPRASQGGSVARPRQAAPRAAPAAPPPPPPVSAANEIVALALSDEDLATLTGQGFTLIEELDLPGFAVTSRRLAIPSGLSLTEARAVARALPSGQDADFNHYYRSEQGFPEDCRGAECPARASIEWPAAPTRQDACGGSVAIGMIDTGINGEHATFLGARLDLRRLAREDLDPSRALHGTAVAALLVGDPATRSPGLVPGSPLVAIDAFHRVGADERADVFTLIESLGLLAEAEVRVINLSLAGPPNTVLAELIERLVLDEDIVVVSAVGNAGPNAEPAYPAAYELVIAVTAVDRGSSVYRRAVRGDHVDLAAPGVDVWTAASISGARWKTGTSYAVPFVTAAAAILREERPDLDAPGVGAELRRLAKDLGEPGPDPVFGAGLLNIEGLCRERG